MRSVVSLVPIERGYKMRSRVPRPTRIHLTRPTGRRMGGEQVYDVLPSWPELGGAAHGHPLHGIGRGRVTAPASRRARAAHGADRDGVERHYHAHEELTFKLNGLKVVANTYGVRK